MNTYTPFRKAPTYVLAAALAAALGVPATASAGVFSSIFELHESTSANGNPNNADAIDNGMNPAEDWESVNTEYNKVPGIYGGDAVVRVFVPDFPGLPGVSFTRVQDDPAYGQHCKDVKDLAPNATTGDAGCLVITGGIPDKNQITNGYAAFYVYDGPETAVTDPLGATINYDEGDGDNLLEHHPGDLFVLMGGDLHAENGNASWGGWFTRNDLEISNGAFTTGRAIGDILVVAEFQLSLIHI